MPKNFNAQKRSDEELEILATKIREDIIRSLEKAGSGHSAGPLGLADIFTALYFDILKHDPKEPTWDQRDLLIFLTLTRLPESSST